MGNVRGFAAVNAVNGNRADAAVLHVERDGDRAVASVPRARHQRRLVDHATLLGGNGLLSLSDRTAGAVGRAAVELDQAKRLARGIDDRDGYRPAIAFGLGTRSARKRRCALRVPS